MTTPTPYVVGKFDECPRCGHAHFGIGIGLCYGYYEGKPGTIIDAKTGAVVDTYEEDPPDRRSGSQE